MTNNELSADWIDRLGEAIYDFVGATSNALILPDQEKEVAEIAFSLFPESKK